MKCPNCGNEITDNQKFCSNIHYKRFGTWEEIKGDEEL